MSQKITDDNLDILKVVKKSKKGIRAFKLAEIFDLTAGGVRHHLQRLAKARKVKMNKKTKVWTAN